MSIDGLRTGWEIHEKQESFWQWRCPWGDTCKKESLLFEDQNRGMVLDVAAHHLCNEHTEFTNDFNLASSCAEIGLTEKIKKSRVFYERSTEHGTEQKEPR